MGGMRKIGTWRKREGRDGIGVFCFSFLFFLFRYRARELFAASKGSLSWGPEYPERRTGHLGHVTSSIAFAFSFLRLGQSLGARTDINIVDLQQVLRAPAVTLYDVILLVLRLKPSDQSGRLPLLTWLSPGGV